MITNLFRPVSILPLVYFRIAFGLLVFFDCCRYLYMGWVKSNYILPLFHFPFTGFEWVPALNETQVYICFTIFAFSGLGIAFGFLYRICTLLLFSSFFIIFFQDQAYYLNHFYFLLLLAFLFIFVSPHKTMSVDNKIFKYENVETVPYWQVFIFLFAISVVYFFGGIAKLDPDWLNGNPLAFWLESRYSVNFCFELGLFMAWTGMFLDLLSPFLLWTRKTKKIIFITLCLFHLTNAFIFTIGIFPWLSMAITALFLPHYQEEYDYTYRPSIISMAVIIAFVSYNLVMPLRHFFVPGDVHWNELGHRFSWRMKLRTRRVSNHVYFNVVDEETGLNFEVRNFPEINNKQLRRLSTKPEMIVQYAHYLNNKFSDAGENTLKIYAHTLMSLNYRTPQEIVDSSKNLLDYETTHTSLLKLIKPLKQRRSFKASTELMKEHFD